MKSIPTCAGAFALGALAAAPVAVAQPAPIVAAAPAVDSVVVTARPDPEDPPVAAVGDARLPVVPQHLYRAELRDDRPGGWFVAPSVEWSLKDAWASLFVDARNLTDERYVSNVSAVTDARTVSTAVFFPGEGRSVFGGLTYSF